MDIEKYRYGGLLAILCCAVFAIGCDKKNVSENDGIQDDSPVAIELSAGNPSYLATTKAAIDEWNDTELYVFGLKRAGSSVAGEAVYDFTDQANIVGCKASAASGTSAVLELSSDGKGTPYFYAEGYAYDFFGCHLGGADIDGDPVMTEGSYSYNIIFKGYNDLMYAATDKAKDIEKSGNSSVTESDVYSAWAARRSVQPTLVFKHALTRLNFIVRGRGNKYSDVVITGIDVKSVNKGVLNVVGPEVGFVTDKAAEPVALSLRTADNEEIIEEDVVVNPGDVPFGGQGACLMVAPDMESVEVAIHMKHKVKGHQLEDHKFVVNASDMVKEDGQGNRVEITSFEAGKSYNFYITVYGPEEIIIISQLDEWLPGGDYEFDPDEYLPPEGNTPGDDNTGDDDTGDDDTGDDNTGEDNTGGKLESVAGSLLRFTDARAGSQSLKIRTDVDDLDVLIDEDCSWVTGVEIIDEGQDDLKSVKVTVEENTVAAERNASVRLISAKNPDLCLTLSVTQAEPYVKINFTGSDPIELDAAAQGRYVVGTLEHNVSAYEIDLGYSRSDKNWITASVDPVTREVSFNISRNLGNTSLRDVYVYIRQSGSTSVQALFKVIQNADYIYIDETDLTVPFPAANPAAQVVGRLQTPCPEEVSIKIPADATWIKEVWIEPETDDIVVNVEPNGSEGSRSATVKIVSDYSSALFAEFLVTQNGYAASLTLDGSNTVVLDNKTLSCGVGTLNTNSPEFDVDIEYENGRSWLNVNIDPSTQYLSVSANSLNETDSWRYAYVTVSLKKYPAYSVRIKVAQKPKPSEGVTLPEIENNDWN